MSVFDTGPPGPEMVTPRLDTGAALENTDDDSAYIVPPKADDKPNPRLAYVALSAEELSEWLSRHITCREEEITSRKGGICP